MKQPAFFRSLLALPVLCAFFLAACMPATPPPEPGAPLVFQTAYPPPPATPTAGPTATTPPYPPPGMPVTTPTTAYEKPPLCQFEGGPTPEAGEPLLDDYVFSEPQIALTSTTALGIAGWLPDNERLLITRNLLNSSRATIETFNTRTGETRVYAEKDGSGKPVWLPGLQAVAYATMIRKTDKPSAIDHFEIWVSYGSPQQIEQVAANVSVSSLSLASDGERLIYFSPLLGDRPQMWSAATKETQSRILDLENRAYSKFGDIETFQPIPGKTFQAALQPQGRWIAFYGRALLFLADTQTDQVCEVDLEMGGGGPRWAYDVQWSADGRYLAMTTVRGYPGAIASYSEIVVLDTLTGEQYRPDLKVPFIYEIAWSPGTHILAVLGNVGIGDGRALMGLFLVDVVRGGVQRMLPNQIFGGGSEGLLAWRPDGEAIAVDCTWPDTLPLKTSADRSRICLIQVTVQP